MLYQLSYASPNSRVPCPIEQDHNCQGYHRFLPNCETSQRVPGCYDSLLECPGAPRRPSSSFCSFSCCSAWLHTCTAKRRPKWPDCCPKRTAFCISISARCARPPILTGTSCHTTPSTRRSLTPPVSNSN